VGALRYHQLHCVQTGLYAGKDNRYPLCLAGRVALVVLVGARVGSPIEHEAESIGSVYNPPVWGESVDDVVQAFHSLVYGARRGVVSDFVTNVSRNRSNASAIVYACSAAPLLTECVWLPPNSAASLRAGCCDE